MPFSQSSSPATLNNIHILALHPYLFNSLIFHTYFVNPLPPFQFLFHFLILLYILMLIINTDDGIEFMTYDPLQSHTELRGSWRYPESEIGVLEHRSRISYMIPLGMYHNFTYRSPKVCRISVLEGPIFSLSLLESVSIVLRPGNNLPIANFNPWAVLTGFSHAVLIGGGHVPLIRPWYVTRGNYITAYNRLSHSPN